MSLNIQQKGLGMPLVLFHGYGFNSNIWQPILPFFEKEYQLILVDLPGFGNSDLLSWEAFKEDLLTMLPKPFALLGWSMGGLFATRLALEEPSKVTHLINVCSSPYFIQQTEWSGIDQDLFGSFAKQMADDPIVTCQNFVKLQLADQQLPADLIIEKASQQGLQMGLDVLFNWDLREDLFKLRMPVLYLYGRLDRIIPKKSMVRMQALYPDLSYHLFQKSAHLPFLSQTIDFVNEVKGFLK